MTQRRRTVGRLAGWGALIFFSLFVVNVLAGKASVLAGATIPVHAGDIAEFLMLLAAVTCFVVAALSREAAR